MSGTASLWRDGERIVASWPAGRPTTGGRWVKQGGTLHLTTERLAWVPLPVGDPPPTPYIGWQVDLVDVTSVESDPEARYATIVITWGPEKRVSYQVAATRLTPVFFQRKNQAARDEAVARITAAVSGSHKG